MKVKDYIKTQAFSNKVQRMTAEMAHHYDDKKPITFCYIELKTPRAHPCKQGVLGVELMLEVGRGNFLTVWADDKGEITRDPARASEIDQGWDYSASERKEMHDFAGKAFDNATKYVRALGVPFGVKIYNNLP